jgi:serine/threonine protein kinase
LTLCSYYRAGTAEQAKSHAHELNRRSIVQQICGAMVAVASKGVVHRDLAAHNVLVFNDNPIHVKLTDFGMSVDDTSRVGVGSAANRHESVSHVIAVRWASPEILAARGAWEAPWSEKSDVWSFGVTVWQVYAHGEVGGVGGRGGQSYIHIHISTCII